MDHGDPPATSTIRIAKPLTQPNPPTPRPPIGEFMLYAGCCARLNDKSACKLT